MTSPEHPIVRRPAAGMPSRPVIVSIPHGGTEALPGITDDDFSDPFYRSFRFGYSDAFAEALYGQLHDHGAVVLTSRYSRLFLDLNRPRDDFDVRDDHVYSKTGVFRTHTIHDKPVLKTSLLPDDAESRLAQFYDPYYQRLEQLCAEHIAKHERGVLVDCHTGSPRRLKEHEIVLGTGRGKWCTDALTQYAAAVFRDHGFRCTVDLSGYTGGAVVRHFGAHDGATQAIQVELNADLIMRSSRREFAESQRMGLKPAHDEETLGRLREAMGSLVEGCADLPNA
jgi:N-formylglutamate deformylase